MGEKMLTRVSSLVGSIMRRNPFGVDICCRKGSRSPLQELYNPIQSWLCPLQEASSPAPLVLPALRDWFISSAVRAFSCTWAFAHAALPHSTWWLLLSLRKGPSRAVTHSPASPRQPFAYSHYFTDSVLVICAVLSPTCRVCHLCACVVLRTVPEHGACRWVDELVASE
ncbi:Carbohydrate sulfotransferase 11 [Tupaia chinensis]|uniref:Carbohydrate sulfotransferase 11 n=1 Tax=Tupaia chinensis TaxID=246437 RepID=L9L9P5_TUPCH|nr:Carbohydrate sulfotransferase 11 [Tupaia chinensis]